MARTIRWGVILLVASLVVAQVRRPPRTNPEVPVERSLAQRTHLSPEAARVLDRACRDCHSNGTVWPWYSHVAPVSWFVIGHVDHGRRHLNFSDWAHYDRDHADELLRNICERSTNGTMPLAAYRLVHRASRIAPDDVRALCEWTKAERARLQAWAGR